MADRPLSGGLVRTYSEYIVRPLSDIDEIRSMLTPHRAYAAYALGQLEPHLFPRCEWWLSRGAGGQALLLHSHGGLGNALFGIGAADALEAVLRVHPGPRFTFLTCQPQHLETVQRHFSLPGDHGVLRMVVDRSGFHDVGGTARRLSGRDVREINRLYRSDGTPAFYTAQNIDAAVYYGVFDGDRMIAVAGTHVISPREGTGVAGNVFVHPRYRGQGLGTMVTGAVTRALLDVCADVVLSVAPDNGPAIGAYRKLGYREVGQLIEGAATRRGTGALSFIQRRLAGLRGRRYGAELVRIEL
jgi:ribosomal protein S18 acetylase RimI-like enzyme